MTKAKHYERLDAIADEMNNRPRKTLNAYSPLEVYRDKLLGHHEALALTP